MGNNDTTTLETNLMLDNIAMALYPEFSSLSDGDKHNVKALVGQNIKLFVEYYIPSYEQIREYDRADVPYSVVNDVLKILIKDIDKSYKL